MRPDLKTSVIFSLILVSLSACSSVPRSSTLTTGIDTAQLAKTAPTTLRAGSDPVCVQFYDNVDTYVTAARKPNPGGNFLKSLGVGVIASVATVGLIPPGLGTVGQVAASQAVSTTVRQGSVAALKGFSAESKVGKRVSEAAAEIGCPLTLSP